MKSEPVNPIHPTLDSNKNAAEAEVSPSPLHCVTAGVLCPAALVVVKFAIWSFLGACCWEATYSNSKMHKGWCSHDIGSDGKYLWGQPQVVCAQVSAQSLLVESVTVSRLRLTQNLTADCCLDRCNSLSAQTSQSYRASHHSGIFTLNSCLHP